MGWAFGAYTCGELVYRFFVWKPEVRRPLGRPRFRCAGHVFRLIYERVVFRFLLWKSQFRRPLWRPRRRWATHVARMVEESVAYTGGNETTVET